MWTKILDLSLPKLPSINQKYISRRFVVSKAYRDFKELVFYSTKSFDATGIKEFAIMISIKTRIDIDNAIKPILDAVSQKVKFNDKDISMLQVFKSKISTKKESDHVCVFISDYSTVQDTAKEFLIYLQEKNLSK